MKRKRRSKFDPYRDLITAWCAQGMTITEMTDELIDTTGEDFYEQALYAYIYRHKLKYVPYYLNRRCDDCEHCHKYINTNFTEGRICDKYWRTIQPNVKNSPKWCANEQEKRS